MARSRPIKILFLIISLRRAGVNIFLRSRDLIAIIYIEHNSKFTGKPKEHKQPNPVKAECENTIIGLSIRMRNSTRMKKEGFKINWC